MEIWGKEVKMEVNSFYLFMSKRCAKISNGICCADNLLQYNLLVIWITSGRTTIIEISWKWNFPFYDYTTSFLDQLH